MSNKLKASIDPLAGGALRWCMAGGGAAWWHIENHMTFWHGAHDWEYFESVREQIFPHDIEGAALTKVVSTFVGKYGVMDVSLSQLSDEEFTCQVKTLCVELDGIYVYTPEALIIRYRVAGEASKKAKRDLRVAMLTLVMKEQPITPQGVETYKPRTMAFGGQLALGMKGLTSVGMRGPMGVGTKK